MTQSTVSIRWHSSRVMAQRGLLSPLGKSRLKSIYLSSPIYVPVAAESISGKCILQLESIRTWLIDLKSSGLTRNISDSGPDPSRADQSELLCITQSLDLTLLFYKRCWGVEVIKATSIRGGERVKDRRTFPKVDRSNSSRLIVPDPKPTKLYLSFQ